MRRFGFILFFTLLVISGLYLSFSLSWSLFYKYTILLHPALGVAVMLFIVGKLFPSLVRYAWHSLHSKLALFFCFIGFFLLFAGLFSKAGGGGQTPRQILAARPRPGSPGWTGRPGAGAPPAADSGKRAQG